MPVAAAVQMIGRRKARASSRFEVTIASMRFSRLAQRWRG
jgi:hypothetical protein